MFTTTTVSLLLLTLFATLWWWRYRSLACPANLAFLIENPYMNTVAGPEKLLQRVHLSEGMRLLDVGSGPGRLSLPAAEKIGPKGEVVALDIQPEMLAKLHRRIEAKSIKNIRIVNAAAGDGAVQKAYFDRALLVTVLGEIPDKHKALLEIYEALKEGGILSITELMPDPHYTTLTSVRTLCREAGFEEIAYFGSWAAFTVNFKKPERP